MDDSENKRVKSNRINFIIIFGLSLGYAIIRYNIFGDVALSQIPSYIMNKALAISAIIFFFLAVYYYFNGQSLKEKYCSKSGTYLVTLHILISLSLFSKDYYPKFYDAGMLSFSGEMVLLGGTVATLLFWNQNKALISRLLMLMFVAVHLFFMGYPDWLTLDKWNGRMPPISLIGFLIAVSGTLICVVKIRYNAVLES